MCRCTLQRASTAWNQNQTQTHERKILDMKIACNSTNAGMCAGFLQSPASNENGEEINDYIIENL